MTSVPWNEPAGGATEPVPARLNVTLPGTPFTVPLKVSTSWKFAVPSAWKIKVPCTTEVPLNVPV